MDVETETAVASGMVERIGESGSVRDHREALEYVLASLGTDGIAAVAHRVVHGGARFTEPVLVEDAVLDEIRSLGTLAPLHHPVNADGIEEARRALPDVPHVAVFDTSFHQTLAPHANTYMGTSLINIDRTYGHLARDSHQHAVQLLDDYSLCRRDVDAGGRSVDVGTTSAPPAATANTAW